MIAVFVVLAGLQSPALGNAFDKAKHSRLGTSKHVKRRTDSDHDGLTNWTEVHRTRTNPHKADTDGDGLNDGTEVHRTKTNPRRADTDGDGFGDGEEIIAGSDPLNPASVPGLPQPSPAPVENPAASPPDATPPATSIGSGPPGTPAHAVWEVPPDAQASVPLILDGTASTGVEPLTCAWSFEDLDGRVWQTREGCKIDFTFESSGMKYVKLSVEGANGHADSNKQSFDVAPAPDSEAPDTTIDSGPAGTTTATTATFSFSANDPGSSFQCLLDSGSWSSCTSPQTYDSLAVGDHTFSVRAIDAAGSIDATPATWAWTITSGSPPPQTSHCFAVPSACGYPDPTNTGVRAGTTLTTSGSIVAATTGQVISARDVTGTININADNVTVEDTRVTLNGSGCGTTNTCGNYDIRINQGVTGTVIKNVETRTAQGVTCEHDIRNTSSGQVQVIGSYLHACDSNLYSVGTAKMTDTYGIAQLAISTDHVENVYFDDGTFTAVHDTLLNPIGQTAVIFGNTEGGSGGPCMNHLTVENSLLAGGGFTIYPCGNASSAGTSSSSVKNTHFARCTTAEASGGGGKWVCSGGPDSNGYYPRSGDYGIAGFYFGGTWQGNVWDDTLASIPEP